MPKVKLRVQRDAEPRDFENKMYRMEQVEGEVFIQPDDELIVQAMHGADWSDDPGTGRAILLKDGSELVNPIPVAPPASIAANTEPSVNDLVERALARHFEQLRENDEIDTLEDMDDFGEDEDWTPFSQFEIVLRDEAPDVPKEPVSEEAVVDVAKAEAELPPAPAKPAKRARPASEVLDEEGGQ